MRKGEKVEVTMSKGKQCVFHVDNKRRSTIVQCNRDLLCAVHLLFFRVSDLESIGL